MRAFIYTYRLSQLPLMPAEGEMLDETFGHLVYTWMSSELYLLYLSNL